MRKKGFGIFATDGALKFFPKNVGTKKMNSTKFAIIIQHDYEIDEKKKKQRN